MRPPKCIAMRCFIHPGLRCCRIPGLDVPARKALLARANGATGERPWYYLRRDGSSRPERGAATGASTAGSQRYPASGSVRKGDDMAFRYSVASPTLAWTGYDVVADSGSVLAPLMP